MLTAAFYADDNQITDHYIMSSSTTSSSSSSSDSKDRSDVTSITRRWRPL